MFDLVVGTHKNIERINIKLKLILMSIMALGEICIFVLFVILGRVEHGINIWQPFIRTALPFAICWFIISPWFGSYKMSTLYSFKKTIWTIPLIWILCGFTAIFARDFITGRPFIMIFVIFGMAFQGLGLIAWRIMFMTIVLRYKKSLNLKTFCAKS